MADSTIAPKDVENWIRNEFLPQKYNQAFEKRKLGVQSGGVDAENNLPLREEVCVIIVTRYACFIYTLLLSKEGTSAAQGWWIKR